MRFLSTAVGLIEKEEQMDCRYCGQPAGFLRTKHKQCETRHEEAIAEAARLVQRAACDGKRWPGVRGAVRRVMNAGLVEDEALTGIVVLGLGAAEAEVLDDHHLDETEEAHVIGFLDSLTKAGVENEDLDLLRERMAKASVLRRVLQGENPASAQGIKRYPGFRFMKSESPIWLFKDVAYEITKTRVRYRGGSRGISFRVARGVYVRTGGFRGEREVDEERHVVDEGDLVVTTKHVYFRGESHRFRVRHDRVVGYDPLPDGFELTRDRMNARPERFYVGDGWFVYNLLINAQDLE